MTAFVKDAYWKNGRYHVWKVDYADNKIRHEVWDPPVDDFHSRHLQALKDSSQERARKADGLIQVARFLPSERDRLWKMGVKAGDIDGINWALKRDEFRHAKVSKDGKLR